MESAYASNRIEGNPMTLPEVTNLLLDDRVPANRNEKEVSNYFNMLQKLDEFESTKLSTDMVLDLHKEVFGGVHEEAGRLRDELVAVGRYTGEHGNTSFKIKHMPPSHSKKEIGDALGELLAWANLERELPIVIKAGIFHHHFVYIHPFVDGNGRLSRILTALLFIQAGYQINNYFILDDYYDIDRVQYSDKLHTADSGDKTEWLEYFAEGVMYSLQSALSKAKQSLRTLVIADRPTSKEKQVLDILSKFPEVTSSDVAKELEVSRQQAHNLLSGLVDKGLLERHGITKSSYYELK
jgi:Fic family protein